MPRPKTWTEREKKAAAAYLKWRMGHTIEDRTPRQIWMAGYYHAKDEEVQNGPLTAHPVADDKGG